MVRELQNHDMAAEIKNHFRKDVCMIKYDKLMFINFVNLRER